MGLRNVASRKSVLLFLERRCEESAREGEGVSQIVGDVASECGVETDRIDGPPIGPMKTSPGVNSYGDEPV
jgi:hypothetical protein